MSARRLPTEERREQLAEAALKILSQQGARALTVKEIAKAVGVTDGAIFRHFKDKEAIFDAAVARFESYLTPIPSEEEAPLTRLERFFLERVQAVQTRPEILGLAFNDRLQEVVGKQANLRVLQRMKESVDFIRACLLAAQAEGSLDEATRPDVVLWMITGVMRGAARSGVDAQVAWDELARVLFPKERRQK